MILEKLNNRQMVDLSTDEALELIQQLSGAVAKVYKNPHAGIVQFAACEVVDKKKVSTGFAASLLQFNVRQSG